MSTRGEAAAAKKPQKVSQKTINDIKQMGMTKAIQKAASGNASAEFAEGAKRMYGQNRIDAAKPKPPPTKTTTKSVSVSKNSSLNKRSST